MNRGPLLVLGSVLFLGVLGASVFFLSPPDASAEDEALLHEMQQIRASLQSIEELLRGQQSISARDSAQLLELTRVDDSSPAEDPLTSLQNFLSEFRATLELERQQANEMLANAGEAQAPSLRRIQQRKPDRDWGALGELREALAADQDRGSDSVRLFTRAEVLHRFGPPNKVLGYQGAISNWNYNAPNDGGWWISVTFHGDLVTSARLHEKR